MSSNILIKLEGYYIGMPNLDFENKEVTILLTFSFTLHRMYLLKIHKTILNGNVKSIKFVRKYSKHICYLNYKVKKYNINIHSSSYLKYFVHHIDLYAD